MKYSKLGSSDLLVSEICLGTVTWGIQNTEKSSHQQLEYALSQGVNFLDTAELYPAPRNHPHYYPGLSEKIIGSWIAANPDRRSELVIASKVLGYSSSSPVPAYRNDPPTAGSYNASRLDRASILAACAASLSRLNTDYIDLYQLQWPDRYTVNFGNREYIPARERPDAVPIRETLLALKELLDEGKIRAYGLCNETTFGVCQYVRIANELGMPRPATIQNDFCLVDRKFESELAEACAPSNFNISLLPWAVLAGGMLTGKYHVDGDSSREMPTLENADDEMKRTRFLRFPEYQKRFQTSEIFEAAVEYGKVAEEAGISLTALAHAFCKSRWFIPSTIVGAATLDQLKENIAAFDLELDEKTLQKVDEIHNRNKDPVVKTVALPQPI